MDFISTIEWLCKDRGITIAKMLSDLDMGGGTFSTWKKRGTIPNGSTIKKISEYFNVPSDVLLGCSLTKADIDHARSCISKIINENNMSFQTIEEKTGTNYVTFKAWINGYNHMFNDLTKLKNLSAAFNISLDYLVGSRYDPEIANDNISSAHDEAEQRLLDNYRKLNKNGQEKLVDYADDLVSNAKYCVEQIKVAARSGASEVKKVSHSKKERTAALDKELPGVSESVKPNDF